MTIVNASYQHRTENDELVNYEKDVKSFREIAQIIDDYPWESELASTEKHGEGGGFYFLLGDENCAFASYQFIPTALNQGLLFLQIVAKPGFLELFGRQTLTKDFHVVSVEKAKKKLRELMNYSIDDLYKKYKN